MKKVKSTGKVGRSSFFNRIKLQDKQNEPMKQNISINHIRQSSYKLERSKSHRKGHSLERKVPIIPSQSIGNSKGTELRELKSEQNTINLVPQEFTVRFEHHQRYPKTISSSSAQPQAVKSHNLGTSFKDFFQFLHLPHKTPPESYNTYSSHQYHTEVCDSVPIVLQQERQMLDLIKVMWQTCIKMKDKRHFLDEILKIEDLLKIIVVKLAKPKLQILEEHSNLSLKIPPFKYSSPNNIVSFKEESKQNSVDNFKSSERRQTSKWMQTSKAEEGEELEFKKIMYILDENRKKSQSEVHHNQIETLPPRHSNNEQKGRKENKTKIEENITKQAKESKSPLSSFNSQHTSRTNTPLIYEQQKINSSYSNDKLFLKNIVKKAKKNPRNTTEHSINQFLEDQRVSASSIPTVSPLTSQQVSDIIEEKQCFIPSISQELSQIKDNESLSYQISLSQGQKSKTQGRQGNSQSKRAVLNNIINMLNTKYNKNIQFQPSKSQI